MDRSAERAVPMKVVSSTFDDDDSSKIHVVAVDDDGETHSYAFTAPMPSASATVTARWRSGALGFAWESSSATLVTSGLGPSEGGAAPE